MCYLTFSFSLNIGFFKNKCKKKNKFQAFKKTKEKYTISY